MDTYGLEQDLKKLFVAFGPLQVMATWTKVVTEFRQALSEYDTKPAVVTLSTVIEPVMKNPIVIPEQKLKAPTPDKEAQKEKMRLHKEIISKKRQELASQGIIPEAQLTEENLKRWIVDEKKNYWSIAESTGCSDSDISFKAKSLNIMSENALYIRRKRAKL